MASSCNRSFDVISILGKVGGRILTIIVFQICFQIESGRNAPPEMTAMTIE